MDSSNPIGIFRNTNTLPNLREEKNSTTKKIKVFGRRVAVAIAKPFCKIGLASYSLYRYGANVLKLNSENYETIANDFFDFPKLVQRMIKFVYPEVADHIPVHPLEQISTCFDENLQLETSGNTVEKRVNNAKLIPNKNNNIKLNSGMFQFSLNALKPYQLKKLLDLINELINNNSLSANEIADLFKVKGFGMYPSLIEEIIYMFDISSNIEQSTSLHKLKLVLDFIYNLEISELDKAKALSSVNLKMLFTLNHISGSPHIFVGKCKYLLDFLTSLILLQLKDPESKDYLTKELQQSIMIDAKSDDKYNTNIKLFTLYISFIIESNLFDVDTIKPCLHNLCSIAVDRSAIDINEDISNVLKTACLLLEKTRITNNLNDKDKINIVQQLNLLQDKILKSNNIEWLKSYTKQLLQFASTIEDLNVKKQLFSSIENLSYGSKINENTFKEYIALIKDNSRLTPEDKTAIATMLENEKLIIDDPILYANARLLLLNRQSLKSNADNSSLCKEAKNILKSLTIEQLVEVLSLKEGLYSQSGMPIIADFIYNEVDPMITDILGYNTVVFTITAFISSLYKKSKISKEDVRKIYSLDTVINNKQLKDIFCDKWRVANAKETFVDAIELYIPLSKTLEEILVEELHKIID